MTPHRPTPTELTLASALLTLVAALALAGALRTILRHGLGYEDPR